MNRPSDPVLRALVSPRATPSAGVSVPDRQRRAAVFGAEADVARVTTHPAAVEGQVQVVAVHILPDDGGRLVLAEALEVVEANDVGLIIVAGEVGVASMRMLADLALVRDCRLLTLIPSDTLPGYRPMVVWEGETPLIQLAQPPHGLWVRVVKRALDIAGATVGLIVAAPVLAAAAVAIKAESRGPVLFRHRRLGLNGEHFSCLKLRTMRADAEHMLASDAELKAAYLANHYKLPDDADPRVTRLGRLLRRTSLDELPQLWNVLTGQMSLVGPRPIVPDELEHYRGTEHVLLSVRPGLTGEWAANGRHHVGYPQRAAIELRYARSWSLGRDVAIMLKTVRAVFDYGSEPLER